MACLNVNFVRASQEIEVDFYRVGSPLEFTCSEICSVSEEGDVIVLMTKEGDILTSCNSEILTVLKI